MESKEMKLNEFIAEGIRWNRNISHDDKPKT